MVGNFQGFFVVHFSQLVIKKMNLETAQNTTWRGMTVTLSQSGVPIDITGASFIMEVRRNSTCATVLEFNTDDNTIIVDSPTAGHFYVVKRLIELVPGLYYHNCKMTLGGDTDEIFSGTWTITE